MNVLFNYYFNFPFCLIQDLEPTKIVTCKNKSTNLYKYNRIKKNPYKLLKCFQPVCKDLIKNEIHIRGTVEKLVNMRFNQIE